MEYNDIYGYIMVNITKEMQSDDPFAINKKIRKINRNSYRRLLISDTESLNTLASRYQTILVPGEHPEFNFTKVKYIILGGKQIRNDLFGCKEDIEKAKSICLTEDILYNLFIPGKVKMNEFFESNKELFKNKDLIIYVDNKSDKEARMTFIKTIFPDAKIKILDKEFILDNVDLYLGNKFLNKLKIR